VLRGTNFQIKVWEALIQTQPGAVLSYSQMAQKIGQPQAQRAVGSALARNDMGYLIPCHRVIQGTGDTGQYRWRAERQIAMQAWEQSALGRSA
jgi:AraC family transcriptional regulator of adaptative response/methylated-DNA-[protein]-cysteine methyltransferase